MSLALQVKVTSSGVPIVAQQKPIQPVSLRMGVRSLASLSGWGSCAAVSCGIGHRGGLDPELLWLWYRPAAVAPIQPLAWEISYATGTVLKRKKKKKRHLLIKAFPGSPI